jgi:hypothetical protein
MNTATFLASLESSAMMGLDDLNYDSIWDYSEAAEEMEEENKADEEEADGYAVEEVAEASTRSSRSRTANYNQVEDVALCYVWMNISMGATLVMDQTKAMFWERIVYYYNNSVEVQSSHT